MENLLPINIHSKVLNLQLKDDSWNHSEKEYHTRNVVRGIILDTDSSYLFAEINRDDGFTKLVYLETSGGGQEKDEDDLTCLRRELKEEMGVEIDPICYLGQVVDQYNLINRTNVNKYYLVRVINNVQNHLTEDEKMKFHLKKVSVSYQEAIRRYEEVKNDKLGHLLYQREVPIIKLAEEIVKSYGLY